MSWNHYDDDFIEKNNLPVGRPVKCKSTKAKAHSRQARYTERMRAKGFTQIKVWVKPEDRQTVQTLAKQLRGGDL